MARVSFMLLVMLVMLWTGAATRAQTALSVQATGQAAMAGDGDSDAARRRALGEALVAAALAGGAELVGYTAMAQARITRDLSVLRATAQVTSHRVIEARRDGQTWTVRIEATVAPLDPGQCAGGRQLVLSIEAPALRVVPQAPAWATELAGTLAADLIAAAADHPRVAFEGVVPSGSRSGVVPAGLDYAALTRGVRAAGPGAHVLALSLDIGPPRDGGAMALGLTADMTLRGPDGQVLRRQVQGATRLPRGERIDLLTGRSRARAEADLSNGVADGLQALLDAAGCEAPSAILARGSDGLMVDIGRRQGLSRGSLGVVEGAGPGDGLLEVVDLQAGRATLRPLDPATSLDRLVGARVRFVETGL